MNIRGSLFFAKFRIFVGWWSRRWSAPSWTLSGRSIYNRVRWINASLIRVASSRYKVEWIVLVAVRTPSNFQNSFCWWFDIMLRSCAPRVGNKGHPMNSYPLLSTFSLVLQKFRVEWILNISIAKWRGNSFVKSLCASVAPYVPTVYRCYKYTISFATVLWHERVQRPTKLLKSCWLINQKSASFRLGIPCALLRYLL